jgi:hypothetical protein
LSGHQSSRITIATCDWGRSACDGGLRLYALVEGFIVHALLSLIPADEHWVSDIVAAHAAR